MKWNSRNIKWYQERGYIYTKLREEFEISVDDLPNGSHTSVDCKCDGCEKYLINIKWQDYKKQVKEDGKYYCIKCSHKLYGAENIRLIKLNNNGSFKDWCIKNNRQDVLDRWDYELNAISPSKIGFGVKQQYYIKCPRNIHISESKSLNSFTNGHKGTMDCKYCNSFAQWGIDNLGEDFLEKYWDYEKNTVNPWGISKATNKPKVYIKCQEDNSHGSYSMTPNDFYSNRRCSKCNESKGEKRITTYLQNKYIINISQKEFKGLVGLKNGNLSYDFYLPKPYNLLIEYQGEQHERYIKGLHKSKKDFEKQQEHDRRKRLYAKNNNINLLEIWYWDFDNIEQILDKYLKQVIY